MQELPQVHTDRRHVPVASPVRQQKNDPLRIAAGWVALSVTGFCVLLFGLQTFVQIRAIFFRDAPAWLWLAYFVSVVFIASIAIGSLLLASWLLKWRR